MPAEGVSLGPENDVMAALQAKKDECEALRAELEEKNARIAQLEAAFQSMGFKEEGIEGIDSHNEEKLEEDKEDVEVEEEDANQALWNALSHFKQERILAAALGRMRSKQEFTDYNFKIFRVALDKSCHQHKNVEKRIIKAWEERTGDSVDIDTIMYEIEKLPKAKSSGRKSL